jgi:hypothetical protein
MRVQRRVEAQDRVQLDPVRRDSALAVDEVEEANPGERRLPLQGDDRLR